MKKILLFIKRRKQKGKQKKDMYTQSAKTHVTATANVTKRHETFRDNTTMTMMTLKTKDMQTVN